MDDEQIKSHITELKGFPTTYKLSGNDKDKWKQLGNAITPLKSFHLKEYKSIDEYNSID